MFGKTIVLPLAVLAAGCGGAPKETPAGPMDAGARVAPVDYRSSFADYQRYTEAEAASWRELNDEVGRLGGHPGALGGRR